VLYKNPTRATKRRDFWIGFVGWFFVNVVLVLITGGLPAEWQQFFGPGVLIANIVVIIVVAWLRTFIALGMLTAFGTALAAVVLGGVVFTAGDFAVVGGGLAGAVVVWLIGAIVIVVAAFFALRAIDRSIR
jgi:hypothetical protein